MAPQWASTSSPLKTFIYLVTINIVGWVSGDGHVDSVDGRLDIEVPNDGKMCSLIIVTIRDLVFFLENLRILEGRKEDRAILPTSSADINLK